MKILKFVLLTVFTLSTIGLMAQTQKVNTEKSTIEWLGKKIGGQHEGMINLKSGSLETKGGEVVSGAFVIDMTSLTNTDMEDEGYKQKLVGHLMSDDFFGVEKFPTSSLKITESTKFKDGKASITGDLTIKGKTNSITFDIIKTNNTYTAKMEIDRSKFDIKYGSTSFFDNLKDKAIDDIFFLGINLILD